MGAASAGQMRTEPADGPAAGSVGSKGADVEVGARSIVGVAVDHWLRLLRGRLILVRSRYSDSRTMREVRMRSPIAGREEGS